MSALVLPSNTTTIMPALIKTLSPAQETEEAPYDHRKIRAPVLTGRVLKLFIALFDSPFVGALRSKLFRDNNYPQVLEEQYIPENPTYQPNTSGWAEEAQGQLSVLPPGLAPAQRAAAAAQELAGLSPSNTTNGSSGGGPSCPRVADFHRVFLAGEVTPTQVAENVIRAVKDSEARDPPMRFLISFDPDHIRAQAAASTKRYASGAPLSPLDGVPFAVKDSVDALPHPTTAGTAFMAVWRQPRGTNSGVQALLDAGAILIGKANLHEIGISTTGLNVVTGTPRNPFDVWRHTGGSSSGSAALVAAGVCPFAIGTDGGGSIRIPAALCGCVGLKPTQGRVYEEHCAPIDHTVGVLGPIAGSVEDCALMYATIANVGHPTARQPPPLLLPRALLPEGQPLKGKRAGIYWEWFDDADQGVVAACKAAVSLLEAAGLEVLSICLPELELMRVAHTCTIISEMRNSMAAALANPAIKGKFNSETQVSLGLANGFTAAHYVQAQKIRSRMEVHFRRAFEQAGCDYIITPTTPTVAPPINRAALTRGITDVTTTISLMRFIVGPNFLGLPAISLPVGSLPTPRAGGSGAGECQLPVGLQLIAPPWHEASLLLAAGVLERALGGAAVPMPAVHYDVLRPEQAAASKRS